MPELNANIPPIHCLVRGNFLRNQVDSHDKKFPVVIFGVASITDRAPVFHFLMEDGGVWWRAPINAFCVNENSPEVDIHELVMWNCFSPYITVTVFEHMRGRSVTYFDRYKKNIDGKYVFTLDWHHPENNIADTNYSIEPANHKCGHLILREDGNFAIQPNNRIRLWDPSHTTKKGSNLIERLVSDRVWGVEDGSKWMTSDDDYEHVRYEYEVTNFDEKNKE